MEGRGVRPEREPLPRRTLGVLDVVALVVGTVVGAAIFETPSLVAANVRSPAAALTAWALGGLVSLVGALCIAELATAFPHPGGDYHFLDRAFGQRIAFLFAWSRMTVIQPGSIALLAFVFGDYASQILRLGPRSSSLYAAGAVVLLTLLNVAGVRQSTRWQRPLTFAQVGGLLLLVLLSFQLPAASGDPGLLTGVGAGQSARGFGLVMVLVLLTYGGWNEAAYLSGELRRRAAMTRALVASLAVVTGLYLLFNYALLRVRTLGELAASEAVGADLMRLVAGERGAFWISVLICASTVASANAVVLTGARSSFALGRHVRMFRWLGRWSQHDAPRNALLAQGGVAMGLVALGAVTRRGFETMVDYTAPVFWLFFLLTALSLFRLRRHEPEAPNPFRVPLYPLVPLVFAATCAYLLWSSIVYTGVGATVGIAVLLAGGVVHLTQRPLRERRRQPRAAASSLKAGHPLEHRLRTRSAGAAAPSSEAAPGETSPP